MVHRNVNFMLKHWTKALVGVFTLCLLSTFSYAETGTRQLIIDEVVLEEFLKYEKEHKEKDDERAASVEDNSGRVGQAQVVLEILEKSGMGHTDQESEEAALSIIDNWVVLEPGTKEPSQKPADTNNAKSIEGDVVTKEH